MNSRHIGRWMRSACYIWRGEELSINANRPTQPKKMELLEGRYLLSPDYDSDNDPKPSPLWFTMSSPISPLHHILHIVAPHPIPLPRRHEDRFAQSLYPPRTWVSGGDTRSSVKYGLGSGLTVAVIASRSGWRWNSMAFRFRGDREVGDSTHYGRCSSSNDYLSVVLHTQGFWEGPKAYQAMKLVKHGDPGNIWG